jgi:hypothetical protein
MASIVASPQLIAVPRERSSARAQAWTALTRVLNLKSVAIVFYFCLMLVIGRMLLGLYYDDIDEWLFSVVRYQRQTLISGFLLLLAIGLTEGFVAWRRWTGRRAWLLGIATSAIAAALSLPIRLFVAGSPVWAQMTKEVGWALSVGLLWTAVGSLAYWFFSATREDELARSALADAECRRETLQAQMVEARLSALQAQIEPHFLFNTLANVKRLYETAPSRGREMLASLIGYLRAALPSMRQSGSTVARELDLARSYLTILKMRMGDRLHGPRPRPLHAKVPARVGFDRPVAVPQDDVSPRHVPVARPEKNRLTHAVPKRDARVCDGGLVVRNRDRRKARGGVRPGRNQGHHCAEPARHRLVVREQRLVGEPILAPHACPAEERDMLATRRQTEGEVPFEGREHQCEIGVGRRSLERP